MDITDIFRNYVKNLKLQRSLFGVDTKPVPSLKFKTKKDEFNSKSKDIVYHITKLKNYLIEHKNQYINVSLFYLEPGVNDVDREKIDVAAHSIIVNCSTLLKDLAGVIKANCHSSQLYEHRKGVLDIVENYLKSVCKMYSDIKKIYDTRQSRYNNMIKVKLDENKLLKSSSSENKSNIKYSQDICDESYTHSNSNFLLDELTKEELQMFEVENEDLISELNNLQGKVKAIEKKVTDIVGLQGTFNELILQQDCDIQRIDSKLVNSTENVQDANTELRKAVQNNATFRFYLLFFILLMSFTLLFLNWYND